MVAIVDFLEPDSPTIERRGHENSNWPPLDFKLDGMWNENVSIKIDPTLRRVSGSAPIKAPGFPATSSNFRRWTTRLLMSGAGLPAAVVG
ncbi:hypothetical protein GR268_33085 [Rhizobium leguminosarum]|nr:hypothetical protein [Rhizobium leguminosarum]